MSGFPHPMVRRSDRNPRAEAVGDKGPSNGRSAPPKSEMESDTTSPDTITESADTDSSDELTEQVAAASPPVSRSPGVGMGLSADADHFPPPVASEVEPDHAEAKTLLQLLLLQAHELEECRKGSEQLSSQLRCHIESFGRQFDKIRDQVPIPEQQATTTGQQQQQQGKICHDETIQKELSDIRAQLAEAKRQ